MRGSNNISRRKLSACKAAKINSVRPLSYGATSENAKTELNQNNITQTFKKIRNTTSQVQM